MADTLMGRQGGGDPERPADPIFTYEFYNPGLLYHVVLFRFDPSVSTATKDEVFRRFCDLRSCTRPDGDKPYIVLFDAGTPNISLEGVGMGFEQAFVVAFKSEGDRNYYVGKPIVTNPLYFDPRHDAFKSFVQPLLADSGGVLVFDYMVRQLPVAG